MSRITLIFAVSIQLILLIDKTCFGLSVVTMWRQQCKNDFGLVELTSAAAMNNNERLSQANEETWKRYHEYRTQVQQESALEEDDEVKARVLAVMQQALQDEARDTKHEPWLDHTFQQIQDVQWESPTQLRSITTCATIFSPLLVPHAIELRHCFHRRPRPDWCEFYCNWYFSLVRFDGQSNGDDCQQELARLYPQDTILMNPLYEADEHMEVFCSNGYLDPPQIQEEIAWMPIEDLNVENFTPCTIQRMRDWLCIDGSALSDYDFMRLVFASFGTAKFQEPLIDAKSIGHVWTMSAKLQKDLQDVGVLDESNKDATSLSWLEYQARLVTGALRPQDKYYQPYNEQAAKSEWGRRVLQVCEPRNKYSIDEDEDLHQTPWHVWERAEALSLSLKMAMQQMTTQTEAYRQ